MSDQTFEPDRPAKEDPAKPDPEPEPGADQANDNGPPTFEQALLDQSYPNRDMTAEERPPIPEGGIEPSPEVTPG